MPVMLVWSSRRGTTHRLNPDRSANRAALGRYTRKLATRIAEVIDLDQFLMLLGGDCSIVLGPTLALRRYRRTGALRS
jgi:arginase